MRVFWLLVYRHASFPGGKTGHLSFLSPWIRFSRASAALRPWQAHFCKQSFHAFIILS
jgi:hypothetical protein